MKIFFVALGLFVLAIYGCNKPTEIIQSEEIVEKITLSEEQIKMAGIQTGPLTKMKIAEYIECTGMVDVPPYSLASVYSPVTGIIEKSTLLEGDFIKKGAVMTTIKHPDLVKLQREFLETKFNLEKLRLNYERQNVLFAGSAGSSKELEDAKASFEIMNAHFKGLKAELKLVGVDVVQLAEKNEIQESIHIYAPISGYITKASINLGKLIGPQDLLYEIIDQKHVHLELKIFAGDLNKIQKNQDFIALMPGTPLEYHGHVYLIGKILDPIEKTARIHGHFEDEPVTLAPGTFMNAKIKVKENETFALPDDALIRQGSEIFAFLFKNNSFEKISLKIGSSENGWTQIDHSNLDTNAVFVTSGAYYIENNEEEEH